MATAQQYSLSIRGYQPLYDWIKAHTWRMHSPPGDHDVTITVGSNNTLEVCASLLFIRAACLLDCMLPRPVSRNELPAAAHARRCERCP